MLDDRCGNLSVLAAGARGWREVIHFSEVSGFLLGGGQFSIPWASCSIFSEESISCLETKTLFQAWPIFGQGRDITTRQILHVAGLWSVAFSERS